MCVCVCVCVCRGHRVDPWVGTGEAGGLGPRLTPCLRPSAAGSRLPVLHRGRPVAAQGELKPALEGPVRV